MRITYGNGRFIEYKKSILFEPLSAYKLREKDHQVTNGNHPMGAGYPAVYLGRSPGKKYQLVNFFAAAWVFIALVSSGYDLEILFRSDLLTESEAESVANQHNATILMKTS